MPRDPRMYLDDVLDTIEALQRLVAQYEAHALEENVQLRWAIERGLQNIGEALFQLKRLDVAYVSAIRDSDRIIGLRHVLVHGYFQVDASLLWQITQAKLVTLCEDVQLVLQDLNRS